MTAFPERKPTCRVSLGDAFLATRGRRPLSLYSCASAASSPELASGPPWSPDAPSSPEPPSPPGPPSEAPPASPAEPPPSPPAVGPAPTSTGTPLRTGAETAAPASSVPSIAVRSFVHRRVRSGWVTQTRPGLQSVARKHRPPSPCKAAAELQPTSTHARSAVDRRPTEATTLTESLGYGTPRLKAGDGQASVTSVSPSLTGCPSVTWIASTTPAFGASTGISIFIDSMMTQDCPSATWSPSLTSIFHTVPVMCAWILVGMPVALHLSTQKLGGGRLHAGGRLARVTSELSGKRAFSARRRPGKD